MFLMILGVSAFQLRSKIRKKSVPGRSKIKPQIGWHLDPIFGGSWDQHGWILEGFGRPSWSHVGTKCHQSRTQKTIKKIITLWEASGTNFNEFLVDLGSNLGGARGVQRINFLVIMLALGAKMLLDPSKSPTTGPKSSQEPNFGGILKDFWLIFVGILVDF